jgi:hypothetical protein
LVLFHCQVQGELESDERLQQKLNLYGEQAKAQLKEAGLPPKSHISGEQANCLRTLLVIISTMSPNSLSGLAIHATSGLFVGKPGTCSNTVETSKTQLLDH